MTRLSATPSRPGSRVRLPVTGIAGCLVVAFMLLACLGSLPFTLARTDAGPRYAVGSLDHARLPPGEGGVLGTDHLGRSVATRVLVGGAISLIVGISAGLMAVTIGTLYGSLAGYAGGRIDAAMMRLVDILYGLPYVLLVVLLAVAGNAVTDEYQARTRERARWIAERVAVSAEPRASEAIEAEALAAVPPRVISDRTRVALDTLTLLVAIGSVSWLTMARVVRGQVLSLKARPFVEAARAAGASPARIFARHLLPNLVGPIVVYATLTVPQAILQESFLSFLGIGIKPPLPSWGNLAADGLSELNAYRSHWWLLATPCVLLAMTLLALNFLGEGLREIVDPRGRERG